MNLKEKENPLGCQAVRPSYQWKKRRWSSTCLQKRFMTEDLVITKKHRGKRELMT